LTWQIYGDAQLLAGYVTEAKEYFASSLRLRSTSGQSNHQQSITWPSINFHPFSTMSTQIYSNCLKIMENCYRILIKRGFANAKVRFYLANLCRFKNDFESYVDLICNDDFDFDCFVQYQQSSESDFFVPEERIWIQQKFLQRVAEIGIAHSVRDYLTRYPLMKIITGGEF
jgi:hypothetical protein